MDIRKTLANVLVGLLLVQNVGAFSAGATSMQDNRAGRIVLQTEGQTLRVDNLQLKDKTEDTAGYVERFDAGVLPTGWTVSGPVRVADAGDRGAAAVLSGKKVSILGDSISTYQGISNGTYFNNTMLNNRYVYPSSAAGVSSSTQTWWVQTIRDLGMELLVNNSYSGDELSPVENPGLGLERCRQLHSNVGAKSGTKPEIILVFFGTNDATKHPDRQNNLELFQKNYRELMCRIGETYPAAEVFYFTLLPRDIVEVEPYNDVIRQLVDADGRGKAHLIDLYRESGITLDNLEKYTFDMLHPNVEGMKIISQTVVHTLREYEQQAVASAGHNKVLELAEAGTAEYALTRLYEQTELSVEWKVSSFDGTYTMELHDAQQPRLRLRIAGDGSGNGILQYFNGQWVNAAKKPSAAQKFKPDTWYSLRAVLVNNETAEIYVDGERLYRVPLDRVAHVCYAAEMNDVPWDAWYHDAVDYALNHHLMSGYNATTFGPSDNLSRAMVVQVLYNKEGQPAVTGGHSFPDVKASDWFNNAVTWANLNGVVGGYGDGRFGPNDNVTLEQIAVILWNYSGNPVPTGDASAVGAHSDWAANALSWAVENQILANVPYENVTATATRAQTAQILKNYLA